MIKRTNVTEFEFTSFLSELKRASKEKAQELFLEMFPKLGENRFGKYAADDAIRLLKQKE